MSKIKGIFSVALLLLTLTACSESDGNVDEYADWQSRNEQYFERQYQAHGASAIIPKWSLPDATTAAHTDCILVDVIESGSGTESPLYNDSLVIHYAGRLIPSDSYPQGYPFDKSYQGAELDLEVDAPVKLASYSSSGTVSSYRYPLPSDFVTGFTTALLHMHRGDHWRVTIPYQLGYGTTEKTGIPTYSTLIFDVWLVDFWSK
ncbi:MAG: FKBP-type peptidyl-prolyl cis-trans isomerase [Prevotella sp.]|nr:FKBP-type peptidyl-prolyl cis-trans isomerase [Prevotella sp.]